MTSGNLSEEPIAIGNAETYDLIVVPEDKAYTLVAEGIDRSGMGIATLAPRAGMRAPRHRPCRREGATALPTGVQR